VHRAIEAVRAIFRASPWTPLAFRALATCVALVVLAGVGHAAANGKGCSAPEARAEPQREARSAPAATASAPPPPAVAQVTPAPRGRASPEDPVYLNQASAEELERLPGVGPKRAAAILALRQRVGRFQRVEDLLRVKGIGRATLKKWRPLVRLDAPRPPEDAGVVQTLTVAREG
jgi:competence protein ComEA